MPVQANCFHQLIVEPRLQAQQILVSLEMPEQLARLGLLMIPWMRLLKGYAPAGMP
jgi:hypothetical protein